VRLLAFWQANQSELVTMIRQHVGLVALATGLAAMVAIPLGVLAARRPLVGRPLAALASLVQTIPSLALFGFLLPLPLVGGVGTRTALVALVVYSLLPMIRTTMTGLATIDGALLEAADAMGMTPWQRLRIIELPLAAPAMLAGLRVAAVIGVGTATIAAAIGAGGLGELIFRGLSMVDPIVILAGAIPAAMLALLVDGALALLERHVRRVRAPGVRTLLLIGLGWAIVVALAFAPDRSRRGAIVVGSKNFTEQVLLGELVAQTLEAAGLPVIRKLNLGGTLICEQALAAGDVDVYVEYTGTALTAIFKEPVVRDRQLALARVQARYAGTGRTVGRPLGFNNTFAMIVRGDVARQAGLRTLSDAVPLARTWRAGFGYEFLEREDGFRGLAARYGLVLREPPRSMDLTLIYRALAAGEVDLIAGDATAGLIPALDLAILADDRGYFPPYDAVPVMRTATRLRHPEMQAALDALGGRVDERTMQRLNAAVDVDKQDPRRVVAGFLETERKMGNRR
jgi:osmoprotectant transport system permease protein